MSKPFIFGMFDPQVNVSEHLLTKNEGEIQTGSFYFNGYDIAQSVEKQLICKTRIYNLKELAASLSIPFTSIADLLLSLYNAEGIKGFTRINGKFTVIIREGANTTIIRDRHGEGPMIYFTKDFFTDSYQGLNGFKDYRPEPDLTGLTTFLKIGYIPAPLTSRKGVQKIPAGNVLHVSNGKVRFEEMFPFSGIINAERKEISKEEAIEKYHYLLQQSILRRKGEMDPVGVLLSGGFDSGGNIAILREVFPGKIKAYSIGFKDNPASELPYARMMAEKFGAEFNEYIMDGTEIEFLPDIIDYMGDPFSESGFMLNHSAMKMVSRENLPVVIGGDGNDQYFGAGIRETALHYAIRKAGLAPFANLFDGLSDNSFFDHDNLAFRIHFQNQKILRVMEPETFGFHDYQLNQMFNLGQIKPHPYLDVIPHKFSSYDELFLQRNYFLHIHHSVDEVILYKASRFSEQFGVNLAFSYTDLDIYNFLLHLPLKLRAKGTLKETMKGKGVSKYIHKELVKPYLPKQVTVRAKQGGFSPLEIFFNDKARRQRIYQYISKSDFIKTLKKNNFVSEFCKQYESLASGQNYWFWYKQVKSNQMINLLILTIWWDKVIGNKKTGKLSDYLG